MARNGKIIFSAPKLTVNGLRINPGCTVYNVFEGTGTASNPKLKTLIADDVVVDDVDLLHNVFNVYQPDDNAEITIKNSSFNMNPSNSNAIRLANYRNAKNVTVTFENVNWTFENAQNVPDADWDWAGLILYQPASNDHALNGNYEEINTWTFKFKNCKYNGEAIDSINFGTHKQLMYFYNLNKNSIAIDPTNNELGVNPTIIFE